MLSVKALKLKMQREITRFEKALKSTQDTTESKKKVAEEQKEQCFEQLSQKALFSEIYKV